MRAWWAGRTPREQYTLALGVLGVVATIGYVGVLEPLQLALTQAEARHRAASELSVWMEGAVEQATRLRQVQGPVGERATTASLSTLVSDKTAEAHFGEALKRMVPEQKGGGVRLWFEGVGFDELLAWVISLRDQHGVVVSAIQVTREGNEAGKVRANLTLEAAGGGGPGS